MLRKTNYNRPAENSTTYEFNQNNQSFQPPKLRPIGKRFEETSSTQYGGASKFGQRNMLTANQTTSYSNDYSNARSSGDEAGGADDEEYEI